MLLRFVMALKASQKHAILLSLDLFLALAGFYGTILTLQPNLLPVLMAEWPLLLTLLSACAVFAHLLDLPRIRLKSYEQDAMMRSGALAGLLGVTLALAGPTVTDQPLPAGSSVVFAMLFLISTIGARMLLRHLLIQIYRRGQTQHRVLIYGAGQTGVQLATALRTDPQVEPVAFIDDNPTLHKVIVAGLPVKSPVRIEDLILKKSIDRVVLAMPSLGRTKQAKIAARLRATGCDVSTLPSFSSLIGSGSLVDRMQSINPSDYLSREGLEWDTRLAAIYSGRTVMITGAGGSIGGELARQLLACRPARIVMFEVSELALYQLERELTELRTDHPDVELIPVLGSVTDASGVAAALAAYGVDIVLHAAAYKHVPMVERNLLAGLRNNVLGTRVVADASRAAGVSHFILISTDKAVRPVNVMGASKRLAELIVKDFANRPEQTRFGIVRFGNVLGSSGSVVPLFEEQIARGGPVTLTHEDVTRYFMTLTEAARLVLLAGNYATGGDVFVLDMGVPVAIRDLARQMIEAKGYTVCDDENPDGDIEIVVTGLRPGEKLHEELSAGVGTLNPTGHPKILRTDEAELSEIEIAAALKSLTRAVEESDEEAALDAVKRWVADYSPKPKPAAPKAGDITLTGGPLPV